MNLWLDDIRDPADFGHAGWTWITTADDAIRHLRDGIVEAISFDHDLGTELTGYDVAKVIEEAVAAGAKCPLWRIHSANPVGRDHIAAAMNSAERFSSLNH